MQEQDLDQVKTDLQVHLVECAANYQELKSETQAQNSKIDYLAKTVEKLADVIVGSAAGLIALLLAVIGFLLVHFVFKGL
ncbi:hypothetical protein G5S35_22310 [Paraburkholderia tropica]|jgi:phosphomevalonate kinase|uniref:hypothetical protein n=1 Tax=Paraburkholderia tropica TaxID=92647 RepID=UPI0016004447|nr:hypothetical protein [Paraburkholderia tropica]QNB14274.1 hypothetical protein G5S35_22310 [Paraburkholderia tropica]